MKYFDTQTGTGTNVFRDDTTTILSNDDRVKEFFKPLPSGYRLEYTAGGLPLVVEIPAPTQEELDQQVKDKRVAEIDVILDEIDRKSVRSMRKKSTGRDAQADRDKLLAFDNESDTLRAERKILTGA